MKSKWKISKNPVGGKMLYGVYRLYDIQKIDHSGNRELFGGYVEDRIEAERIAEKLNREEADG